MDQTGLVLYFLFPSVEVVDRFQRHKQRAREREMSPDRITVTPPHTALGLARWGLWECTFPEGARVGHRANKPNSGTDYWLDAFRASCQHV